MSKTTLKTFSQKEADEAFFYVVKHRSRLGRLLKLLSVRKLKAMVRLLNEIILEAQSKQEETCKAKQSLEKEICRAMGKKKLSIEEQEHVLESVLNKIRTPPAPVKAKYKIVIDGIEHTWAGRGRKPKVFADWEKNNDLETALIKD